jgi:ATP-dependent Clp protease adaptor protein ClpS
MRSSQFRHDESTNTMTRNKLQPPSMYMVVFFNDDFTAMIFVIEVLVEVFHVSTSEATTLMLQIHKEGKANVGCFTYEVAETKATTVVALARKNEYPLLAVAERI